MHSVFLFKQKTAYEMRISDWSSDVCSSDLQATGAMMGAAAQDSLRWGLMEVFGRSAVPLLGLISGWLVEGSSRTHDWLRHVGRKVRTILLPMILWNALAILFVSGAA